MRLGDSHGGRRPPFREPRLRLLIVCGGECTEPAYLRGLNMHLRNPAVQIKVKAKVRAPEDLVRYARSFDQVWCVVDADEFDLESAIALAAKLDVQLAVSNPCFELWLLLHHQDCMAPCFEAKAVLRQLTQRVPGYQKNGLRFADFQSGLMDAVQRAERLDPTRLRPQARPAQRSLEAATPDDGRRPVTLSRWSPHRSRLALRW